MSFKKALPFKKAVAFAGAASMLLGVSSLSAYQNDWSDKKLSPDDNNSWFKVDGEIWAAYEFADKRPDNKIDYNGFKLGRAVVNLQGEGTKGDAEGWGYRILIDANTSAGTAGIGKDAATLTGNGFACDKNATTSASQTNCSKITGYSSSPVASTYFDGNTPMTPYVKYAYFQVPLMKGTTVRAGFQPTPAVSGGSNLEGIWGHRFLDADGKAMWEELGLSSSADAGLGIQHKNDLFGLDLLVANGEGFNQVFGANGGGTHLGLYQVPGGAASLQDVAQGNKPSMGLDLLGNFYLTPMKSEKDSGMDLTISFPFTFKNVYGMNEREYRGISALDFSDPTNPAWTYISGDARAKKDYKYGVEVDAKLKLSADSSVTIGGGTAVNVDRQDTAIAIPSTIYGFGTDTWGRAPASVTWPIISKGLGSMYYEGRDARGRANYVFVTGQFGHVGFATRYSSGTGTGTTSEKMGTATPNGMAIAAEQNLFALQGDDFSSLILADKGLAKFKKVTVALTYEMNKRFRVALGFHEITASATDGNTVKVDPLAPYVTGSNLMTGLNSPQTNGYGKAGTSVFPGDIQSGIANKTITSTQLFGVNDRDRQTFLRMVYYY